MGYAFRELTGYILLTSKLITSTGVTGLLAYPTK